MEIKKERENILKLESLVKEGRGQEALNIIDKLNDDFNDSFQIKFIKAKILIDLQKNISAEEILNELEKEHKDNLNLLRIQSEFYEKINMKEKCLVYLEKINFIDPFNNEVKEKIEKIKIQIEREKMTADTLQEKEIIDYSNSEDIAFSVNDDEDEIEENNNDNIDEKVEENNRNEDEFATMSAAEIYIKQGLFKDALNVLEKIYIRDKSVEILDKINTVKKKIGAENKIRVLNNFMDLINKKGDSVV